jgi:ASC-1-like (ASCH) protein
MQHKGEKIKQDGLVSKGRQYDRHRQLKKGNKIFIGGNQVVIIIKSKIKQYDIVNKIVQEPETAFGIRIRAWRSVDILNMDTASINEKVKDRRNNGKRHKSQQYIPKTVSCFKFHPLQL